MSTSERIFVTGYAKLPQGIAAKELYNSVAVGMILNKNSGCIIDIDISLATSTGKAFVKEIVVGNCILNIDCLIGELEKRYLGHAKNAIISALRCAHQKYEQYITNDFIDV